MNKNIIEPIKDLPKNMSLDNFVKKIIKTTTKENKKGINKINIKKQNKA